LGVRNRTIRDIQFPQRPDEANGSACTFELKPVVRWLGEVNLTGGRGHSRPPEAIGRAQRAQLWKIPGRLLAECCLPIRSERTGPGRKQDCNRAFRYSESGSKKHSLEVRNCSRPSACRPVISSVQKIHASLARVYLSNSKRTSGFRWSCCRRGDGCACRRLLGQSCSATGFV
jgi:hypothetical protein